MTTRKNFLQQSLEKIRVGSLTKDLREGTTDRRLASVTQLAEIGGEHAFKALVEVGLRDKDVGVSAQTAAALATLGNPDALGPLLEVASQCKSWRDEPWDSMFHALICVGRSESGFASLIDRLESSNEHILLVAAEALGEIGDARAAVPLAVALTEMRAGYDNGDVHARAIAKLGGDAVVGTLIQALKAPDYLSRALAARALGRICTIAAVVPLIALVDESERVPPDTLGRKEEEKRLSYAVRCAAEALGTIGDKRAVEPLIKALACRDYRVGESATVSLGLLRDRLAVGPLIEVLEKGGGQRAKAAAEALRAIADPAAVDALIRVVERAKGVELAAAVVALVELGGSRAVEPLGRLLVNREQPLRHSLIVELLVKLGDQRAVVPLIGALERDLGNVADALGILGDDRAVKPLIGQLKVRYHPARVAAGKALVTLYRSGRLNDESRVLIRQQRATITQPLSVNRSVSAGDESVESSGIGVDFPDEK
jgi:HEAT repeat protein